MRTGIISKYHVFLPAKRLENIKKLPRFFNKIEDRFFILVSHFQKPSKKQNRGFWIFFYYNTFFTGSRWFSISEMRLSHSAYKKIITAYIYSPIVIKTLNIKDRLVSEEKLLFSQTPSFFVRIWLDWCKKPRVLCSFNGEYYMYLYFVVMHLS